MIFIFCMVVWFAYFLQFVKFDSFCQHFLYCMSQRAHLNTLFIIIIFIIKESAANNIDALGKSPFSCNSSQTTQKINHSRRTLCGELNLASVEMRVNSECAQCINNIHIICIFSINDWFYNKRWRLKFCKSY